MSVVIVTLLIMCAAGCSQTRVEYVAPIYVPLSDNISKPNPEPAITEQNLVKWKDALKLMNEYKEWGEKEQNRANSCVIIYKKLIGENTANSKNKHK